MSVYPRKANKKTKASHKRCAMCCKVKQLKNFHLLNRERNYHCSYCKPCLAIYMRSRYLYLKDA